MKIVIDSRFCITGIIIVSNYLLCLMLLWLSIISIKRIKQYETYL